MRSPTIKGNRWMFQKFWMLTWFMLSHYSPAGGVTLTVSYWWVSFCTNESFVKEPPREGFYSTFFSLVAWKGSVDKSPPFTLSCVSLARLSPCPPAPASVACPHVPLLFLTREAWLWGTPQDGCWNRSLSGHCEFHF